MLRALPDINHVALADFKEKLKYRPLQHIILFCKLKKLPYLCIRDKQVYNNPIVVTQILHSINLY